KELDGHRLHGRRIGVRDADNKEKRSKGPAKGLKLYVGNLPFDADEKAITAFFGDKATITEIAIATDKGGKPKGFAFVFIDEKDKGEDVVKALNGQELNGRRLKVDISQAGGKKKSQGGKSARELKAIAEEKRKKQRR
ncbi:MAG: RNA-binding protein, partial [Candidatus Thermoplasmatota archaeon]|nr:RNA-binding protein [Candidatus Thermoplasmatota archaeon]